MKRLAPSEKEVACIEMERSREMKFKVLKGCSIGLSAICLALFLSAGSPASAQSLATSSSPALTEEQAHAIGVDAYVYFYPLITMDITRKQSTNIEPGKEFGKGPMNMFINIPAFPPADMKVVVRPNFDTLYSIAWLDLTKEPMIVSAPDTDGRYYLLPMLDMWTDVFASPGWRTTGTQGGQFSCHSARLERNGPGRVHATSRRRRRMSGSSAAPRRTARRTTTRFTRFRRATKSRRSPLGQGARAGEVKIDPSVDMKTPPKTQVDTMPAGKYFAYAAELLKLHPPHITDQPIIAQMKRIGIEPGKSFDFDKLDPAVKKALESAPEDAQKLMDMESSHARAGRERLVDEYRHDGRLWQLLPETRHRLPTRPWRKPARGRDLSAESLRRHRQAARRREQVHDPLRQGSHAAGECLLVDHALR